MLIMYVSQQTPLENQEAHFLFELKKLSLTR